MINEQFITDFKEFCENKNWTFNNFCSEFTFQFRLARFMDSVFENEYVLELESNINRYNISGLVKKEIDIDILKISSNVKHFVEIKYLRDKGTFNIGMFDFCKDIKFLEQLKINNLGTGTAILFTTIKELYTKPNKQLKPRNDENLSLYKCFREEFVLKGQVSIKTGKRNESLSLDGNYALQWFDFTDNIKVCFVSI